MVIFQGQPHQQKRLSRPELEPNLRPYKGQLLYPLLL
jgi:hypothetical protein